MGGTALIGILAVVGVWRGVANYSTDSTQSRDAKAFAAATGSCLASPDTMKVPLTAQDMGNLLDLRYDADEQGIDIEPSCVDAKLVRTLEVDNPDLSYDTSQKRFLVNGHPVLIAADVRIPEHLH